MAESGSGSVMIREAIYEDFNGLMKLYTQLHDTAVPEKDGPAAALWTKIVSDRDHHIIVAEEDGEIVSSCVCVVIPCLTRAQRPFALVENVVTDIHHRRKGLASACLQYAKEIAVDENCYKLMLMTGSKQESTFRFYESTGYNRLDKTAFIQWLKP